MFSHVVQRDTFGYFGEYGQYFFSFDQVQLCFQRILQDFELFLKGFD